MNEAIIRRPFFGGPAYRKEIINVLGGNLVLAQHLGVRPVTVRSWVHDGVPEKHIEKIKQFAAQCGGMEIDADKLR